MRILWSALALVPWLASCRQESDCDGDYPVVSCNATAAAQEAGFVEHGTREGCDFCNCPRGLRFEYIVACIPSTCPPVPSTRSGVFTKDSNGCPVPAPPPDGGADAGADAAIDASRDGSPPG